jgi:hypothetical protein
MEFPYYYPSAYFAISLGEAYFSFAFIGNTSGYGNNIRNSRSHQAVDAACSRKEMNPADGAPPQDENPYKPRHNRALTHRRLKHLEANTRIVPSGAKASGPEDDL